MGTFVFSAPLSGVAMEACFRSIVSELERDLKTVPAVYLTAPPLEGSFQNALVCLGVAPLVKSIAHARRMRAHFIGRGVPAAHVFTVLFEAGMPGALSRVVVEEQMGPLTAVVPHDPALFAKAENENTTIQLLRPKSAMAAGIKRLVAKMSGVEIAPLPDEADGPTWSKSLEKKAIGQIWEALGRVDGIRSKSNLHLESLVENEFNAALLSANGTHSKDMIDVVRQNVKDHVMGLGPLQKIMRDPLVTEIMVNGETEIYIERDGRVEKSAETFANRAQLLTIIDRVVSGGGRRVDVSSPLCDARLADGSRVNVVLPPVSLGGPLMTIRRFRDNMLTLDDLENKGSLTRTQGEELKYSVLEHKNVVVAGNSGSGKTTLLNILSGFIDPAERIITIEDSAELKLQQPHVVRLETRTKNADGVGAVGVSDLVVNALRMRPDRLVIGECRGAEVIPMLQAMNTGHDGSLTTVHANSARDALSRFESMALIGAPHWPIDVVREQIRSAIDVIVYLKRAGSERKLVEILHLDTL